MLNFFDVPEGSSMVETTGDHCGGELRMKELDEWEWFLTFFVRCCRS